jgi:hypothetical protein
MTPTLVSQMMKATSFSTRIAPVDMERVIYMSASGMKMGPGETQSTLDRQSTRKAMRLIRQSLLTENISFIHPISMEISIFTG